MAWKAQQRLMFAGGGTTRKGPSRQPAVDAAAARRRGVPANVALYNAGCALYNAAANGDATTVRALLRDQGSRSQIEWAEPAMGWQPLHVAAYSGHKAVVQLLIAAGADVHATAAHGRTALMCAAEQLGPAEWFSGVTPMNPQFISTAKGKYTCASALLVAGADPAAPCEPFGTAIESAGKNYPQLEMLFRCPPPRAARACGLADRALLPGSRVSVPAFGGEGVYVRWEKCAIGANKHVVRFAQSGVRSVEFKKLKPSDWSVLTATDLTLCQARQRLAFALCLLPEASAYGDLIPADVLELIGTQLPTPSPNIAELDAVESLNRLAEQGTVQEGLSTADADGVVDPSLGGWMEKKGEHPGAGWKRRWFRLDGDCLCYYERPAAAAKGYIALADRPVVRLADCSAACAEIEVLAERRTFRLRCASHTEAVGWIRVIGIPEEGVPGESDAPTAEAGDGAGD